MFEFKYTVATLGAKYQQVVLSAPAGPLGTRDYRIVLEVASLDAMHSFLHMSYSYRYGTMAKLAMRSYLATGGRNKIGFTRTGLQPDGQPLYIGSQRGVVERNTMRYYLAIVAYLGVSYRHRPRSNLSDVSMPGTPVSKPIRRSCMNSPADNISR